MSISKELMLKLQNGSDVRGVAVEGVEGQQVNLTGEAANLIAQAFALWLAHGQACQRIENRCWT